MGALKRAIVNSQGARAPDLPGSLIPEISLIKLDAMTLQERDEFFLERGLSVMLSLSGNVPLDAIEVGIAYRERIVAGLPGEIPPVRKYFVNPPGS